ncbi:hypothetical protein TYRP_012934 [Tyrophagus putrescentiae]|nr:hypothetical protein TYRP_012934 [Tyrophagus putrescentiae]
MMARHAVLALLHAPAELLDALLEQLRAEHHLRLAVPVVLDDVLHVDGAHQLAEAVLGDGKLRQGDELLRHIAVVVLLVDGHRPLAKEPRHHFVVDVRLVAAIGALDENSRRDLLSIANLIAFLLLDLQRQAGADDAGGQGEDGHAEDGEAGGDDLAAPVLILVALHEEGHIAQSTEDDELGVEDDEELLPLVVDDRPEHLPRLQRPIQRQHLRNLKESVKAAEGAHHEDLVAGLARIHHQDNGGEDEHQQVDEAGRGGEVLRLARQPSVLLLAAAAPQTGHELDAEPDDDDLLEHVHGADRPLLKSELRNRRADGQHQTEEDDEEDGDVRVLLGKHDVVQIVGDVHVGFAPIAELALLAHLFQQRENSPAIRLPKAEDRVASLRAVDVDALQMRWKRRWEG